MGRPGVRWSCQIQIRSDHHEAIHKSSNVDQSHQELEVILLTDHGLKLFRNYQQHNSTTRSNQPMPGHSFSTTPPPYVTTATSDQRCNGPMGSMYHWMEESGITRTSFLLLFVGMLSRCRLQLQLCRWIYIIVPKNNFSALSSILRSLKQSETRHFS